MAERKDPQNIRNIYFYHTITPMDGLVIQQVVPLWDHKETNSDMRNVMCIIGNNSKNIQKLERAKILSKQNLVDIIETF